MNTVLGEALKKANITPNSIKKTNFSSFIWKGEKYKEGNKFVQKDEKIEDMSEERLRECYNHCLKMLYNDNPKNLGRYKVLEEVNSQIEKCNIELFLRYCENSYKKTERNSLSRNTLRINLRQFMENTNKRLKEEGKKEIEDWNTIPISEAASHLPEEFQDISIADVLDGCIDYLGAFSKQHLTMAFITKKGLWFTKAEESEFKNISNADKIKTIKAKFHLPDELVLRINEKGLSYHEMRAMLLLPKKQKYSEMTTEQLVTLSTKVLPRFQKEIDGHIFSWKRLQRQIELVAKSKGIDLND